MYRAGTDVGGTFTDAVLMDESTGEIKVTKLLTTPPAFEEGTLKALSDFQVPFSEIGFLVHGTTVVINALIESKGAKTGLITTRGFRDVLEIARSRRAQMYNLQYQRQKSFVPRYLRMEVDERIDYKGRVIKPLNEKGVFDAVSKLKEHGVESIAVCLLNSHANHAHEERVGEILRQEFPKAFTSLSSELWGEYREYERTSTAVINAYVRPISERYLTNLTAALRERQYRKNLLLMQTNGGVMTADIAKGQPIYTVESGPVAGGIGAMVLGKTIGYENIISYDMGGTTAKSVAIVKGVQTTTLDYKVRDIPIRVPVVDIREIGAGGGSIAWMDSAGALHVGPQSSGADPGPACYNKGGVEPAVTDADLIAGKLNPDFFLGGKMRIYPELSRKALAKISEYYKMSMEDSAIRVLGIVDANMSGLLRAMSIERGLDPREFAIVAMGGAGPMHVMNLAEELKIQTVIIPRDPGVFSAWGMLMTDLRHDFMQTHVVPMAKADVQQLNEIYEKMVNRGAEMLKREGLRDEDMIFTTHMDIRYVGQEGTLQVPVPTRLAETDKKPICEKFDDKHEATYHHCARDEEKEIVALSVTATGAVPKPAMIKIKIGGKEPQQALSQKRRVHFGTKIGQLECPIYRRAKLLARNVIDGPAIIEETTSTTVLNPGQRIEVDVYGNLIAKLEGA